MHSTDVFLRLAISFQDYNALFSNWKPAIANAQVVVLHFCIINCTNSLSVTG